MPIWATIILAILGSTGFFSFINALIARADKKKDKKNGLKQDIDAIKTDVKDIKDLCTVHEKDICRTQLLVLIADYPQDRSEILRLAEHYFADLEANWYMSSIFVAWLKQNNIERPAWFKGE